MPTVARFTSNNTTEFAQLATRAADTADRAEAAGFLVAAALLREIADEVEVVILGTAPPQVMGWVDGGRAGGRRPGPTVR